MRILQPFPRRAACIATAAALLIAGTVAPPQSTVAQTAQERVFASAMPQIDRHIAEAARRFGLPAHWIRAVIAVESAGNPRAVSRAGAMGLMQIMPATWAELRAAHGLGEDPFDPRENIFAGAAYLRAMHDRFGVPGFLAAYNAGPGRYAEHLATGRPLPRETRDYVSVLVRMIGGDAAVPVPPVALPATSDWRDAPLFAGPVSRDSNDGEQSRQAEQQVSIGLFVPLQSRGGP